MIDPNNPYCDLVDTGYSFNNKRVYGCSYCGIKIGLDSSDTKMLCFKKIQDYSISVNKIINPGSPQIEPITIGANESMQEIILEKLINEGQQKQIKKEKHNHPNNLCTQEQIESRLAICRGCEYFKDNSCMLCGCRVVRDANHMNKLAHKDQKCPADKWGPIVEN